MKKKFKLKIEDKEEVKFIKNVVFEKSKITAISFTEKQEYAESWFETYSDLIIPIVSKHLKKLSKTAKLKKVVCYAKK